MSARLRIMAHLVAGHPDPASSLAVARALADGGSAYLEVQFPFSDPSADGPDIQAACASALAAGFSVSAGFELVAQITRLSSSPVFLMSYANLVFTRGVARFLAECRECGVEGVIVPDLPFDCDEGLFEIGRAEGLAVVPVVSPGMPGERLQRLLSLDLPFLYATLRKGITGAFTQLSADNLSFLGTLAASAGSRENADGGPRLFAGFGVSSREQVEALSPFVDAVVVGSAFVREIRTGVDPYGAVRAKMRELCGA